MRVDGNVLLEGDVFVIPGEEPRREKRETGAVYVFQALNTPALLRLQIFSEHNGRAGQIYRIRVDDEKERLGQTDDKGILQEWISPNAKRATKIIGKDNQEI